jgi:hypothetical protein
VPEQPRRTESVRINRDQPRGLVSENVRHPRGPDGSRPDRSLSRSGKRDGIVAVFFHPCRAEPRGMAMEQLGECCVGQDKAGQGEQLLDLAEPLIPQGTGELLSLTGRQQREPSGLLGAEPKLHADPHRIGKESLAQVDIGGELCQERLAVG